MGEFDPARELIVAAAQELVRKGYLMGTGGNLSARMGTAFAVTPSNYDYAKMTAADVCVLSLDLQVLEGRRQPSVEAGMHAAVYQARPDVHAIVHTHQPYASALTLIKAPLPALFDEQVRFLGRGVEIIPYAPSGTAALAQTVARYAGSLNNAYLMQNHGALVLGPDMERAIHNVEVLEKCAQAYLLALCAGRRVSRIPPAAREAWFAKLRADQTEAERGEKERTGE